MIKITELSKLIDSAENSDASRMTAKEYSKLQRQVVFYRTCKRYLESGATEDFIKKELKKLHSLVHKINSDYKVFLTEKTDENPKRSIQSIRKEFYTARPISAHNRHIKNLQFILNNGE